MKKSLIALLSLSVLASCGAATDTDTTTDMPSVENITEETVEVITENLETGNEAVDAAVDMVKGKFMEMTPEQQQKILMTIQTAATGELQEALTGLTDLDQIAQKTQEVMKKFAAEKFPEVDFGSYFDALTQK